MADTENQAEIYGMDVNYAAANSWYAYIPLENILGQRFKNLNLHLTRFSLPSMDMGSTSISYKGYTKEIPTKIMNPDSKQLTLDYIVDEKWRNYRALYSWMSGIYGNINPVTVEKSTEIQAVDYLPLRIYLLDNFKNKTIEFLFENCWIKTFNDLTLEMDSSDEITHSFTFCYDIYSIADL